MKGDTASDLSFYSVKKITSKNGLSSFYTYSPLYLMKIQLCSL